MSLQWCHYADHNKVGNTAAFIEDKGLMILIIIIIIVVVVRVKIFIIIIIVVIVTIILIIIIIIIMIIIIIVIIVIIKEGFTSTLCRTMPYKPSSTYAKSPQLQNITLRL